MVTVILSDVSPAGIVMVPLVTTKSSPPVAVIPVISYLNCAYTPDTADSCTPTETVWKDSDPPPLPLVNETEGAASLSFIVNVNSLFAPRFVFIDPVPINSISIVSSPSYVPSLIKLNGIFAVSDPAGITRVSFAKKKSLPSVAVPPVASYAILESSSGLMELRPTSIRTGVMPSSPLPTAGIAVNSAVLGLSLSFIV